VTIASLRRSLMCLGSAVVIAAALNACKQSPAPPIVVGPDPIDPFTEDTVTLVGAGDIGDCSMTGPYETATLLDGIQGTIFTAGDNVQGIGSGGEYRNCFAPSWGRHLDRIRPSPGNHDYLTQGATGYFGYFGERAGPSGRGYYSYNLGAWHVVSLNSNVPVDASSAQMQWLRNDLTVNTAPCIMAYWHHPLFDASVRDSESKMRDVWRTLYDFHAEIVVNGHLHEYTRIGPIDPDGRAAAAGIRQFIVGTGGAPLNGQPVIWGVLKLTLRPRAFDWRFVPVAGRTLADAGSATCVQ
jgi:hypothetical protein